MKPVYSCFLVNGKVVDASEGFHPETNRSFLFGDGVFETMRMENGRLLYSSFHFDRLTRSLNTLGIETEGMPQPDVLEKLIVQSFRPSMSRVKLLAFRSSPGSYVPKTSTAGFHVQIFPIGAPRSLNEKGLTVGLYEEQRKAAGALSWMKSTSSLLYVMAGRYAEHQGWDDILLLNDKNELMEGSSSNLFAFLNGQWVTPPISSGCIEGVYRRVLITSMEKLGIPFTETDLRKEDALRADELILTNAISGFRWIAQFEGKTYRCSEAKKLFSAMQH